MRVVVSSHARFHVAFVFHTLSLAVLLSDLSINISINHMFFWVVIVIIFSLYTTNFTEPLSYQDSAFLKLPKFP